VLTLAHVLRMAVLSDALVRLTDELSPRDALHGVVQEDALQDTPAYECIQHGSNE
jgi:hypothetical protein